MSRFNLKKFKPDQIVAPGRDSTKLAVWILKEDPNATYQDVAEAAEAAEELGLGFSGRAWGSARTFVGLKSATKSKKRSKRRGRKPRRVADPELNSAATSSRPSSVRPGTGPLDLALERLERAESEMDALKAELIRMRVAFLG